MTLTFTTEEYAIMRRQREEQELKLKQELQKAMQRGTVLFTKKPRLSGNGIVLGCYAHPYLRKTIYKIETDYGNRIELSAEDIKTQFDTRVDNQVRILDPDLWRANKAMHIATNRLNDESDPDSTETYQ